MATRIDTVDARTKLKARTEPYWTRIGAGCQLGFRRMSSGSAGTWIAKYRNPASGERQKRSLGEFDHLTPSQRFDAAKKAAEAWFEHLGRGGVAKPSTIADVCHRYVAQLRATKGGRSADDAQSRFRNYVLDHPKLAATDVTKLTPGMIDDWRKSLQARPITSGSNRGQLRSASTLNRDMTCFRAALNFAHLDGVVTSDFAWRAKLRPLKDADRRRELYLDLGQRRKLIERAPPDLAAFLRGLALVPLRPGALASLTAAGFDKRLGVLAIGKDKAGRDRKIKLPAVTAVFFSDLAKDKLPSAPLFARADGKAWDKDAWKWPVKEAVLKAELPASTTAYTLRHSTITDLVTNGLDVLTVAALSGASVLMIQRHYGHLRADVAAAGLATLAL